ncbi:MAG: trimeric intracellular cation channel family protein, partial [Verrucomicrobiales bacterium]
LGVITGTFGGVIGDVICNRVPSIFRTAPLYATCSFAGCWAFFGFRALGAAEALSLGGGIAIIVALRLAALRWNLRLPLHS